MTTKTPATKNIKGKTRNTSEPYEEFVMTGWTWKVLKHYQSTAKELANPYARVLCAVSSPMTHGGVGMGDVYISDIPGMKAYLIGELADQKAVGMPTAPDLAPALAEIAQFTYDSTASTEDLMTALDDIHEIALLALASVSRAKLMEATQ